MSRKIRLQTMRQLQRLEKNEDRREEKVRKRERFGPLSFQFVPFWMAVCASFWIVTSSIGGLCKPALTSR